MARRDRPLKQLKPSQEYLAAPTSAGTVPSPPGRAGSSLRSHLRRLCAAPRPRPHAGTAVCQAASGPCAVPKAAPFLLAARKASGELSSKGLLESQGQRPDLPFRHIPRVHRNTQKRASAEKSPQTPVHSGLFLKSPESGLLPSPSPGTRRSVSDCPSTFPARRRELPPPREQAVMEAFRGGILQKAPNAFASATALHLAGKAQGCAACSGGTDTHGAQRLGAGHTGEPPFPGKVPLPRGKGPYSAPVSLQLGASLSVSVGLLSPHLRNRTTARVFLRGS